MLFEQEHFGKPISVQLSEYLKANISKNDLADVATKTDVSISTVRDVMYRNNGLTENNSTAIVELVKIAIANCNNMIGETRRAKSFLEKLMEKAEA